jgi:hypothetical protein
VEPDDDLVADSGGRFQRGLGRVLHDDVVADARIVGSDVEIVAAALERAGEGGAAPLDDLDDLAGVFTGLEEVGEIAILRRAEAHDDLVALQCHAGVLGGDEDAGLARFGNLDLREDHGRALLAEVDRAGDEVGLAGQAKAVALDEDEAAGLEELGDLLVELAAILGIEAPFLRDGGGGGRDVAAAVKLGQKAVGITHNSKDTGRAGVAPANAKPGIFWWNRARGPVVLQHANCPRGQRTVPLSQNRRSGGRCGGPDRCPCRPGARAGLCSCPATARCSTAHMSPASSPATS